MSDAITPQGGDGIFDGGDAGVEPSLVLDVEEFITSIAGLGNVTIQFTAIPRIFTAATVCVANGGELKLIGKAGTLSEALAMLNESIARASQAHGQG